MFSAFKCTNFYRILCEYLSHLDVIINPYTIPDQQLLIINVSELSTQRINYPDHHHVKVFTLYFIVNSGTGTNSSTEKVL
jgi:hypothetical protein